MQQKFNKLRFKNIKVLNLQNLISKHDFVYRLVNMILIGEFPTLDVPDNRSRNELVSFIAATYSFFYRRVMEKMAFSCIVEKQEMVLRTTRLMN